ncbi:uncharacterized protein LOC115285329 [Suricata suricatta]|uniref:uncharacterized protein LOC115285329 n=1 Tax=Suricata suricatta TaxID=37032 RepID=UPI001155D811|nr:uncharacterized protein LOC115285329 [Suricata suricatta]
MQGAGDCRKGGADGRRVICHLPSVHSHGSSGDQPGPRPSLQATSPWACPTLSEACSSFLHNTPSQPGGTERWPSGEMPFFILARREIHTPGHSRPVLHSAIRRPLSVLFCCEDTAWEGAREMHRTFWKTLEDRGKVAASLLQPVMGWERALARLARLGSRHRLGNSSELRSLPSPPLQGLAVMAASQERGRSPGASLACQRPPLLSGPSQRAAASEGELVPALAHIQDLPFLLNQSGPRPPLWPTQARPPQLPGLITAAAPVSQSRTLPVRAPNSSKGSPPLARGIQTCCGTQDLEPCPCMSHPAAGSPPGVWPSHTPGLLTSQAPSCQESWALPSPFFLVLLQSLSSLCTCCLH